MTRDITVCRCTPPCEPRVAEHDGLTFVVPTWCPTPQPWNNLGAWIDHRDLDVEVVAAIRAAVPNWDELRADAATWSLDPDAPHCGTFWGGHGCDRPLGHDGLCVCGEPGDPCSVGLKYGDGDTFILSFNSDADPSPLHWEWYR